MEEVSVREFAKREGISHTAVNKAIKEGRLPKLPSGKLDAALVGSGWRAGNRRAAAARLTETPEEAAERAVAEAVVIPPIADSEAQKEFYLAELRRLEFDVKSGLVAPVAEMTSRVSAALARVRTRLLAFPAEASPALDRCKTPAEIETELRRRVTEVLEELANAGGSE